MAVEYHSGARQSYGPYEVERKASTTVRVAGVVKQLIQPVHYDELPAASTEDEVIDLIPANAFIVSARLYTETDFDSTSGTTALNFGLQQPDGTEIDNDGLVASLTADGSNAGWTVGAGALVGAGIGANAGQIVVTEGVGDLTAGVGYLVVEYIEAPDIS